MFIGNICYVIQHYNEQKFQLLTEYYLTTEKAGAPFTKEFTELAISAMLDCEQESEKFYDEILLMKKNLYAEGISYLDARQFKCAPPRVSGNPIDAVRAFNEFSRYR